MSLHKITSSFLFIAIVCQLILFFDGVFKQNTDLASNISVWINIKPILIFGPPGNQIHLWSHTYYATDAPNRSLLGGGIGESSPEKDAFQNFKGTMTALLKDKNFPISTPWSSSSPLMGDGGVLSFVPVQIAAPAQYDRYIVLYTLFLVFICTMALTCLAKMCLACNARFFAVVFSFLASCLFLSSLLLVYFQVLAIFSFKSFGLGFYLWCVSGSCLIFSLLMNLFSPFISSSRYK